MLTGTANGRFLFWKKTPDFSDQQTVNSSRLCRLTVPQYLLVTFLVALDSISKQKITSYKNPFAYN